MKMIASQPVNAWASGLKDVKNRAIRAFGPGRTQFSSSLSMKFIKRPVNTEFPRVRLHAVTPALALFVEMADRNTAMM